MHDSVKRTAFMLILLFSFIFFMNIGQAESTDALPELYFHQINIGCANANLITVGDTVILVDCGTDTDAGLSNRPLLDYLAASGIDHIDRWILTHYHNDHAINLNVLLELYGTEDTVVLGPSARLPDRFLPLAAGSYIQLSEGDRFSFDGIDFLCLGPEPGDITGEFNKDSLNIRMDYGETSFMITGDCVADNMLKRHPEEIADIDVLCFPHHGLVPYKISQYILTRMNCSLVLVSSNAAGNIRVYCKNAGLTATVFCSGGSGNIVVTSNGRDLTTYEQVEPGQFALR